MIKNNLIILQIRRKQSKTECKIDIIRLKQTFCLPETEPLFG